jgi:hypothetical protein
MLRDTLLFGSFAACLVALPRAASAQVCALDADCPDLQICTDLECAEPQEPGVECDEESPCEFGDCVAGACKLDAVHCAAEGSACTVHDRGFSCECAGGEGFGGFGGDPGEDGGDPPPLDPEAMYQECLDFLGDCSESGDGDGDGDEGDGDGDGDGDNDEDDKGDEGGSGGGSDGGGGDEGEQAGGEDDQQGSLGERGCRIGGTTPVGALALLLVAGAFRRRWS